MAHPKAPVLSVVVRRFDPAFEADIRHALEELQKAAKREPGFLGEQNSLSAGTEICELVTVFAFDTPENLEKWERSDTRRQHIAALDAFPQQTTKHRAFDEMSRLLHPASSISKLEIVLMLIFLIFVLSAVLGYLAALLLPAQVPPVLRNLGLIAVNVALISYVFLPWCSKVLTKLKSRLAANRRDGP